MAVMKALRIIFMVLETLLDWSVFVTLLGSPIITFSNIAS